MSVSVQGNEAGNIVPYFFIGGMEDVGAIAMVFDTGLFIQLRIAIAADVFSFFDDEYTAIELAGDAFREDRSQETAAYDHIGKGFEVNVGVCVYNWSRF